MLLHAGERGLQLKPGMNFTGFRAEELGSFTPDTLRKAGCAFALKEDAL